MPSITNLLDLPDELLLNVLDRSTYTTRATQSLTCRRLNRVLKDVPQGSKLPRLLDLLLLEQTIPRPSRYACSHCLRLLPCSAFMVSQVRDRPRGYWPIPSLLDIEAKGNDRPKYQFLFNTVEYRDAIASKANPWGTPFVEKRVEKRRAVRRVAPVPKTARKCLECLAREKSWNNNHVIRYPVNDSLKGVKTGIICKRCNQFTPCEPDSRALLNRRCDKCLDYRPPGTR